MVVHPAEAESVATTAPDDDGPPDDQRAATGRAGALDDRTLDKWMFRVVGVLTVAPIVIGALRAGLSGWVPALDAAHTVTAAKYSLGRDPLLVGMYTDAANWIDTSVYFPGPWLLWWMAIPVRVLGATWGPLLSMAALNSGWIVLAAWAVRRRLGYRRGALALVFMGATIWTFGNALFYSPVPMLMVVPAFMALVFVAWAVAAGDGGVLWLLALLTNFVLLDHLVLTAVVPPIVIAALVCWGVGVARDHRRDPPGRPGLRRRTVREAGSALVVTLVMWLPSLVQQVTADPGNLTNLWRANAASPPVTAMWGRAWGALLRMFTEPPFWLHGSRTRNLLLHDPSPATTHLVVGSVALLGTLAVVGVAAWRLRDRSAVTGVALGAVTLAATWYNLAHPRTPAGLPNLIGYLLSTWVSAMFVTFAVVHVLVRLLRGRFRKAGVAVMPAAAACLFALNLPHSNITTGTYAMSDEMISTTASLDEEVTDTLAGTGRVAMAPANMFTRPAMVSIATALDESGVAVCVDGTPQWTEIPIPGCHDFDPDVTVRVRRTAYSDPTDPGGEIIASHDPLDGPERRELDRLDTRLETAFARGAQAHLTAAHRDRLIGVLPDGAALDQALHPEFLADPLDSVENRRNFANLIRNGGSGGAWGTPVRVDGISTADLRRWAELEHRRISYSYIVTATRGG